MRLQKNLRPKTQFMRRKGDAIKCIFFFFFYTTFSPQILQ